MLDLMKGHEYSTEFEEMFAIRNLAKQVFAVSNPIQYARYGGNCCRQMAFICRSFLREMIPDYTWESYESTFLCVGNNQKYEHAWCYGTCDGKPNILVDLAFDNGYNLNYIIESETNDIPCDDIEDKSLRIQHEEGAFEFPEFYTSLVGSQLIKALKVLRRKQIMEVS